VKIGEDRRVRFKADDACLRVDVHEVKNGHPDVAAAVQDERVSSLRFKVIDAMDEDILVEDVEVWPIVDANGVVQALRQRTRLCPPHLSAHPRKMQVHPPFIYHLRRANGQGLPGNGFQHRAKGICSQCPVGPAFADNKCAHIRCAADRLGQSPLAPRHAPDSIE